MELVNITTGEPITRAEIEAEWLADQPATVMVPEAVEGEDGPETIMVEIANHPEFPLPEDLSRFDLTDYGAVAPEPADPPVVSPGQIAERDGVEKVGGAWRWKWKVRPRTATELAEAKTTRKAEVDAKRDEVMSGGFVPASGPLAGHRLQTRNLDDRANWLTSQAAYSAAVAGGHGDVMGAKFRTADNETIVVSFADGLAALLAMAAWGAAVIDRSWTLKDSEIAGAGSFADLAEIDIDAGWPE